MIGLDENLLTLKEAAASLPHRRAGRPTHISTLWRWTANGLRGVRLESICIGGCRMTSREALTRFFAALSGEPVVKMPKRRTSDIESADSQLEAEGF